MRQHLQAQSEKGRDGDLDAYGVRDVHVDPTCIPHRLRVGEEDLQPVRAPRGAEIAAGQVAVAVERHAAPPVPVVVAVADAVEEVRDVHPVLRLHGVDLVRRVVVVLEAGVASLQDVASLLEEKKKEEGRQQEEVF